jgi:hypothetical protein
MIWNYIKIGINAVSKFLKWTYAAELTVLFLSIFMYILTLKVVGTIFFMWGALLLINSIKQNNSKNNA